MKENKILKLIYQAWRERWSDSQFGINIKSVLPRGVSGDVYNLAECLIQQALIGSTANKLILDHLKHSLCSHLVSHAAVIQSISKFEHLDRIYCVISLLEFLETIIDGICCRTKAEENLLPTAMSELVLWLMKNILNVAQYYGKQKELSSERSQMLEKACLCINKIVDNEFFMIIYHIGFIENKEVSKDIVKEYLSIKAILTETSFVFPQLITELNLQKLAYLQMDHFVIPPIDLNIAAVKGDAIAYCVQPLLSTGVTAHPSKETIYYVAQMKMLQKLRKFSNARLFYEIIRAGFMTINIEDETSHDIMWGAFTFFKIPQILKQLSDHYRTLDPKAPTDYSNEMVEAFEMLFEDSMLLDCFSSKCTTTICESFLKEWMNLNLINETHMKKFMAMRKETEIFPENNDMQSQPSINLIIRAEVPLSGFLKTLNADYNKVQEALLGVLNQVLVGNSFELILSVAIVEGHIKTFVARLIQCNENSVPMPTDSNKHAIRSALFDVSFLMLTTIIQKYGRKLVLPDTPGDSFFEHWVRNTMFDVDYPKNYEVILEACDDTIVREILASLMKPDTPLNSSITWKEICKNIPAVIYQVLIAWETEALSAADVKAILDNMKSQLFAYSVIASSFLATFIDMSGNVNEKILLKPLNMIQQFLTHPAQKTPSSTPTAEEESPSKENYTERLCLLHQIIRQFQQTCQPSQNQSFDNVDPVMVRFEKVWNEVKSVGWLPTNEAKEFEVIASALGPDLLALNLIEEVLKNKYTGDMSRIMDLVFGIFHLDIEAITVSILDNVLPRMLRLRVGNDIFEPQTYILCRLAVHCIISCVEVQHFNSKHKKRSRSVGGDHDKPDSLSNAKQRKINTDAAENACANDFISDSSLLLGTATNPTAQTSTSLVGGTSLGTGNSNDTLSGTNDNSSAKNNSTDACTGVLSVTSNANTSGLKKSNISGNKANDNPFLNLSERVERSLSKFFKKLQVFVNKDEVSPKVIFVFQFISLLIEHGQDRIRAVLRLLPANLMQNLLKLLINDEIKVGLLARIHDLHTVSGRHQAVADLSLLRNIQLRKTSSINL